MLHCGIVILAAGEARRFGRPKQLALFQGTTLIRRCVQTALGSRCRPVIVVTGNQSDAMKLEIAEFPVSVIVNEHWQDGMGTSIAAGVKSLAQSDPKPEAVCLLLCDQPMIASDTIDKLLDCFTAGGKLIVAASYCGTVGTPAVFAARLFDELIDLCGSQGGKSVIQRHSSEVCAIDLPEAAADIYTEADLARFSDSTQSAFHQS